VDIFFNQNHGALILLGYLPYVALCYSLSYSLLSLPVLDYSAVSGLGVDGWGAYAVNAAFFIGAVTLFYWLRYGGTFRHRLKPEWDGVPEVVKEDAFLAKAAIDDLVALEDVFA
jgi:hypothetical protein